MARGVAGVAVILTGGVVGVGGCALPPAEACRAYVACQTAVDRGVDTSDYDEGGRCWALPDTARTCEATCLASLDALRATPSPPAACEATGGTTGD